jgi:hypothetical protein
VADKGATMTETAKPAEAPRVEPKTLYDWTSQDHDAKCPQYAWQRATKDQQQEYLKKNKGQQPKCSNVPNVCCPEDIVLNAGVQTIFIGGADGDKRMSIGSDAPRMDPGDRRQGAYYADLIRKGICPGLQQVKRVSLARLADLEKTRQIREGERPADWILKARARSAEGKGPMPFMDKRTAMTELQQAAGGLADPEDTIGPSGVGGLGAANPLLSLGGDGHGH